MLWCVAVCNVVYSVELCVDLLLWCHVCVAVCVVHCGGLCCVCWGLWCFVVDAVSCVAFCVACAFRVRVCAFACLRFRLRLRFAVAFVLVGCVVVRGV